MYINKPKLRQFFKAGYEFMSESSLVICGIARDCSSQFINLIPKLENLGDQFKEYKIIVVENDSQDSTGTLVSSWALRNRNVLPIVYSDSRLKANQQNTNPTSPRYFDRSRISSIAFARNLYLHELDRHQQADFVIVVDLDILDFSISGISTSFDQRNEWDCATSSGLRYTLRAPLKSTVYWDTYAYEPSKGFSRGIQSLSEIRSAQKYLRERIRSDELIPALSAFGGLAIYKYPILAGQEYEIVENDDPEVSILCEHVALHRSIARANKSFRLVINPMQELRYESPVTTLNRNIRNLFSR